MEQRIVALVRQGKKAMDEAKYNEAKQLFLDAAQLAVEHAKDSDGEEKDRFQKVATDLIRFAKQAKNAGEMENLQEEVSSDLKTPSTDTPLYKSTRDLLLPDYITGFQLPPKVAHLQIPLGETSGNMKTWDPGSLMNGIQMVVGVSGSGKTEWLKSLAVELTSRGYPVLILDLHGDIDLEIPTVSIDYRAEFGVNPLELLSTSELEGGPEPQIHRLIQMFDNAVEDAFSATQIAFIRSILEFAYHTQGIKQTDPETWGRKPPTFGFLEELLTTPDEILDTKSKNRYIQEILGASSSTIAAVKNRLLPILTHPAFSAKYNVPTELLTQIPLRVILKPLQTVSKQFIVADTVLRQLFSSLKSRGHVEHKGDVHKFRVFVIIDEVKILSGYRGKINDTYHIINRLATEARKFGIGLILASQTIRHFGRDVQANSATKIMLRAMDSDEARDNAKELDIESDKIMDLDQPGLGFFTATNLDEPIKIQLYPCDNRPIFKKTSE